MIHYNPLSFHYIPIIFWPDWSQEILEFFSAWPSDQRERVTGLLSSCSKSDAPKADASVKERIHKKNKVIWGIDALWMD